ncbi:MAG: zinc permease [Cellulomonas sp. 73-145]|uniref:ZIP family metal transporter n=1 Tax=Cellulomonas sp. 73-145 TaxID=1895739 RepID=UPI000928F317|nr:ZIP family metal transporter [Cellulomonas sp. 73-145]MBN9327871.1 ZIP family metal transporter [Cellulomonas sp.]OJV60887.1 MAG: zinc permease [Cellulomonas sp. 73-145]
MGIGRTLLLGFVAGVTILLGLPVGRLRRPAPTLRAVLNATAVGVLLFLVWDVLSHAWEPMDSALGAVHDGTGGIGPVLGLGGLFVAGLAVGLGSLVVYERWMARNAAVRPAGGGTGPAADVSGDPGRPPVGAPTGRVSSAPAPAAGLGTATLAPSRTTTAAPLGATPVAVGEHLSSWSPARRLALLIAIGIGLHNFAEGLAIGQSAGRGEVGLATLLVIGFALHNGTEGFGITAPLAGDVDADGNRRRPSWAFLLTLGLIGGGPTFVGTALGHGFTSEPVSVLFLTLAAGSILYVVTQLLGVAAKAKRADLLAIGLLIGLVAGFATDAIVTAAGA